MNTKTVTFNMPIPIYEDLRVFVGNNQMSKFVSLAVKEKLSKEREKLRDAYMEAEKDRQRTRDIHEWSHTEVEGWQ